MTPGSLLIMSPEPSTAAQTSSTRRRTSTGGYGGRSSGSPRHRHDRRGSNQNGHQRQNGASPKMLFQQNTQAVTPPLRYSAGVTLVTREGGANNNGSPTVVDFSGTPSGSSFAGSKFNEAPSPDLLPPPPAHWLPNGLSHGHAMAINQNIA